MLCNRCVSLYRLFCYSKWRFDKLLLFRTYNLCSVEIFIELTSVLENNNCATICLCRIEMLHSYLTLLLEFLKICYKIRFLHLCIQRTDQLLGLYYTHESNVQKLSDSSTKRSCCSPNRFSSLIVAAVGGVRSGDLEVI